MPNSDEKYHVFISHSSKDANRAMAVCKTLERRAVRCWIAPRDIVPGTEWGEAIIDGIDRSRILSSNVSSLYFRFLPDFPLGTANSR